MFFDEELDGSRVDRQRVNVPAHQFSGGSIDHSMPLHLREAREGRRDDGDVEMPALARAGVAGMFGTVVTNLEQRGMQRLFERGAQSLDAGAHADSLLGCPRMIQNTIPRVNTNNNGTATKVLKFTQASWLMRKAIQRLAAPSAR